MQQNVPLPSPAGLCMQQSKAQHAECTQTLVHFQLIITLPLLREAREVRTKLSTRGDVFTRRYKTAYTEE